MSHGGLGHGALLDISWLRWWSLPARAVPLKPY